MGGSASTEETVKTFEYKCHDYFVAKFLAKSSSCKDEITRITQDVATAFLFSYENNDAKIIFTLKNIDLNANINQGSIEKICKQNLDKYFAEFISVNKDISKCKNPPNYCFIRDNNLNCDAEWNLPTYVRITGKQKDVKKALAILKSLQQKSTEPPTTAKPKQSNMTALPSNSQSNLSNNSGLVNSSKKATLKNSTPTTAFDLSSSSKPFTVPSTPSSKISSSPTSISSHYCTPPSKTSSDKESEDMMLSFRECIIPAKDISIGHFIRFQPIHTYSLKNAFQDIANVNIEYIEKDKKIEFHFESCKPDSEKFKSRCEKKLEEFLSDYKKVTRSYTRASINNEKRANSYFFQDSDRQNNAIYYRWYLNEGKIFVSGLVENVDRKLEECDSCLQVLDREFFRFEIPLKENETSLGYFIKNKPKYRNSIQENFRNICKVYVNEVEQGKISLTFKSNIVISGHEIDVFQQRCSTLLSSFLKLFDCKICESRILMKLKQKNEILFECSEDVNVKILGTHKVKITGLKESVNIKFALISELIREERSWVLKFDNSSIGQFVKFSNTHFERFQNMVSDFARVSIVHNTNFCFQSTIKLDDNENKIFIKKCQESFKNFTSEFEAKKIETSSRNVIDILRQKKKGLLERTDEIHISTEGTIIKITGIATKVSTKEDQINNIVSIIKSDLETSSLLISTKRGILGDCPDLVQSQEFLTNRSPHQGGGPHLQGIDPYLNSQQQKQLGSRNVSQPSTSGNVTLQVFSTTILHAYKPKVVYREKCEFVIDNPPIFSLLKKICNNLCFIDVNENKNQPLMLTSKKKIPKKDFALKSISRLEDFFTDITEKLIELKPNVITTLKNLKPDWLLKFNLEYPIALIWKESNDQGGLLIKGPTKIVSLVYSNLQNHMKERVTKKSYSLLERRKFISCKVVENLNEKYDGVIKIDCTLQSNWVVFTGMNSFILTVQNELTDCKGVFRKPLLLSKLKLEFLEKFFSENKWQNIEDKIFTILQKNNAEGNVAIGNKGKLELLSSSEEMFDFSSNVLEKNIFTKQKEIPDNIPDTAWTEPTWIELEKFDSENEIMIFRENSVIHTLSLNNEKLEFKFDSILKFLQSFLKQTVEVTDLEWDKKFVEKYHANEINVLIKEVDEKVYFEGLKIEIDKALSFIKNITWRKKTIPYKATLLSNHFQTDSWLNFQRLIEIDNRCVIGHHAGNISSKVETNAKALPSEKSKPSTYGNITVEVTQGDISLDNSNIIVNGVISDFNLSRGAISSSILRRGGQQLQIHCNKNCVVTKTNCRVTRAGLNLSCDYVLHLLTPTTIDDYVSRIKEALDVADLLGEDSIAFPTLGTGGVGLNCENVAACMSQAFQMFAAENPTTTRIKVLVYEATILDIFKNTILSNDEMLLSGEKQVNFYKANADVLEPETINITLLSDKSDVIKKLEDELKAHFSKHLITKKIDKEVIKNIGDNEIIDIHIEALKHGAHVIINQTSNEIHLSGLEDRVSKLLYSIKDILSELKEALVLSKMISWKWKLPSSSFCSLNSFPVRTIGQIEKEYQKHNNGSCNVLLYGKELKINFNTSSFTFQNCSGTIMREDLSNLTTEEIPSNWDKMLGKSWRKINLKQSSNEYLRVLNLFKKSSSLYYNNIISIERIQNLKNYQQYQIQRKDVEKNMIKNGISERHLFHGTSQEDAEKICAHGFDKNFAGKNATVYGRGVYFAVNSSYSINYCQANINSHKFMFLADVLTGDFCKGCSSYKAPPEKRNSHQEGRLYDSVVDDENNPTIFVVFRDSSVYPSYLITFK